GSAGPPPTTSDAKAQLTAYLAQIQPPMTEGKADLLPLQRAIDTYNSDQTADNVQAMAPVANAAAKKVGRLADQLAKISPPANLRRCLHGVSDLLAARRQRTWRDWRRRQVRINNQREPGHSRTGHNTERRVQGGGRTGVPAGGSARAQLHQRHRR